MQKAIQSWFGLDEVSAKLDHLANIIAADVDDVNVEERELFLTSKGIVNSIICRPSIDLNDFLNKKAVFYKP